MAGLPEPPTDGKGGFAKGYQAQCSPADKNIRIGLAEEFDEGWQGGCPDDMVKCTLVPFKNAALVCAAAAL